MKDYYKIFMLILLSLPVILFGSDTDYDYEFVREDSCCSFRGNFTVKAEPDNLVELIYDFDKIKEYTVTVKSLELVRRGEDWYEVAFTYQDLLVFENQSIWRRTINRAEKIIVFEMISSWNNSNIIPELLSSTGYYQFKPAKEGCLVEFFQECRLKPGLLNEAYYNKAEKDGIKFLSVFKDFIEQNCD